MVVVGCYNPLITTLSQCMWNVVEDVYMSGHRSTLRSEAEAVGIPGGTSSACSISILISINNDNDEAKMWSLVIRGRCVGVRSTIKQTSGITPK